MVSAVFSLSYCTFMMSIEVLNCENSPDMNENMLREITEKLKIYNAHHNVPQSRNDGPRL